MKKGIAYVVVLVLLVMAGTRPARAADVVVGTGTPASCTEAAFDAALATVQAGDEGTIRFDCGPGFHTIDIYTSATITKEVIIDGEDKIRLLAQGSAPNFVRQRFFEVQDGGALGLTRMTLEGGRGPSGDGWGSQGGSIVVWGASYLDVQGSTITDSVSTAWGGAIANEGGAVRIQNSTISGVAKWGGAYNGANGFDFFEGATVINSTAQEGGGGVRLWNTQNSQITDSTISDNTSDAGGGGIENLGGTLTIRGSIIERNAAHTGGGLMSVNNDGRAATTTLENSLVSDNAGVAKGGGIYSTGTLGALKTTFSGNAAEWGGGLASFDGRLVLVEATFSRNRATIGGGGLYIERGGATIDDSIISENEAPEGGGLYATRVEGANADNWVKLAGTFFIANEASSGAGGAILARRAYATVNRAEIADNSGAAVYLVDSTSGGSYMTISQSSIHDNGSGLYNGRASTLLVYNTTVSQNGDWGVWAGIDSIYTQLGSVTLRGNADGQINRSGGRLALDATAVDRGVSVQPNCKTDPGLPALEGSNSWSNDGSCGGSVSVSSGFNLGLLALNGGQTANHLPGDGSVLIDAIACGTNTIDQRGAARPQGAACDVGAVEVGAIGFRMLVPMVVR